MTIAIALILTVQAAGQETDPAYEAAYTEITEMLDGKREYSFKRAVFVTENAYTGNEISYEEFEKEIGRLAKVCVGLALLNNDLFQYEGEDRDTILRYGALFTLMTDTITMLYADGRIKQHMPFAYDFEDPFGKEDWEQMFVSKLLNTTRGNCHSLPYLYKMIAEEMGLSAHLALAPNHIYIKHKAMKTGMYNTELTSGTFPIDAWLMASGYIHTNAVRNGIYMERLNDKQSLALCLTDLAKGYERKIGLVDDGFVMRCSETALRYYPNYVNASLMKADALNRKFQQQMETKGAKKPNELFENPESKALFVEYEKLVVHLHQLGYRKMPERMYLDWLVLLQNEKEKYTNKKISINFNNFKLNKP